MGIHSWTQTGKGTHIRALCQKIKGSTETKQRSIKMDSYDPICERCLEEDESATHVLCDCESIAHLGFHHLGQFFMEPSDYYDAPISKVIRFIQSVVLIEG
jgi:hypothetical protein